MRIDFEFADLRAFCVLAEKLSFRAAADALFISQPAMSRRIDKLETALQVRLLERTTRRVSLTAAGRVFRAQADEVLGALENAVSGVQAGARRRAELVTLACVPSLAYHLLPGVLVEFARVHPEVRVKLIDESAPAVVRAVSDGSADFGLGFLGGEEPSIEFRKICREPYLLAMHPSHRLAARASVDWSELQGERFVSVAASSGNRMLIDHAMGRAPSRPPVHYETNHIEAALALVDAGLGVAAIPKFALANRAATRIAAVPLARPAVDRTLGLIVRKGDRTRPATAALIARLVQAIRSARRDGAGGSPPARARSAPKRPIP